MCRLKKKKLALFLKRYKSTKSKIQTAWHQPFFEQFGGVFPTAKENELQNYGHPFTKFNPDCRCIIIISVYQRSPINDLINTKIILHRVLEILVQALGDGDRNKMRMEQQRQAEGTQLYLILCRIQEMLLLFPPPLNIWADKSSLIETPSSDCYLIILVRILHFTVLIGIWSCTFHKKSFCQQVEGLNLRRLTNPGTIFSLKKKKVRMQIHIH